MKLPKMKFTAAGDMLIQRIISTDYEGFRAVSDYIRKGDRHTIRLRDGSLTLEQLQLGGLGNVTQLLADGRSIPFRREGDTLCFEPLCIRKSLVVL